MPSSTEFSTLADLEFTPYLDDSGQIAETWDGKIGVYSIFDRDRVLQFVNYSRNIYASLKQHLIRQPDKCYWLKVQTIARPSRTILQDIQTAWIAENQATPPGNEGDRPLWLDPIDAKLTMTEAEHQTYAQSDDLGKSKLLKNVARRHQAEILQQLEERGSTIEIRFNPKLKEQGLLDLK